MGRMYRAYRIRGQVPITLGVMFLSRFSHLYIYMYLSLMKNICVTFLRNYESQKAETWYKHGQWMKYCAYRKRGQGPIALGVNSLDSIYFNSICILLITFCTCGPSSGKLISYLFCRLRKVW